MHENITKIAKVIIDEIEKYYPGLTKKNYDRFGHPSDSDSTALKRVEFILVIELLKAGVNSNKYFKEKQSPQEFEKFLSENLFDLLA